MTLQPNKHQIIVEVDETLLDANKHVSNVEYIRLMQDIAVAHSDSVGCTRETIGLNCTWFVRSHSIEYKRPAVLGDTIVITTWIDGTDLLRSTRKYTFESEDGDTVFAKAETVWILVDVSSGRPRRIPADLIDLFREEPIG